MTWRGVAAGVPAQAARLDKVELTTAQQAAAAAVMRESVNKMLASYDTVVRACVGRRRCFVLRHRLAVLRAAAAVVLVVLVIGRVLGGAGVCERWVRVRDVCVARARTQGCVMLRSLTLARRVTPALPTSAHVLSTQRCKRCPPSSCIGTPR